MASRGPGHYQEPRGGLPHPRGIPTGSASARNQHQLPAPGREHVQALQEALHFTPKDAPLAGSGRTGILLEDSPFL